MDDPTEIKREVAAHFQKVFKDQRKLKIELTGNVGGVIKIGRAHV